MPEILYPATGDELRGALLAAASARQSMELFGGDSKRLMAGAVSPAKVRISTTRLCRLLQYEPRDLTVSVQAGMRLADLNRQLAVNNQMLPLDGPWSETATVGGMMAANISGHRRRLYGAARDLVIGMQFATLEGKLVETGGMVVKNVAGLDMAKMMIGSFGTLAAIVSVNFKVVPRPAAGRTYLISFADVGAALAVRDEVIRGYLNPVAVDLLNPVLSTQLNLNGYVLAMLFNGNELVMNRVRSESRAWGPVRELPPDEEAAFWNSLDNLTPEYMDTFRDGAVVRLSCTLSSCGEVMKSAKGPCHAHAGSGIVRSWFPGPDTAAPWLAQGLKRGCKGVVECAGGGSRPRLTLWPEPGGDLTIMKQIKHMFDPEGLLNRGRLYGQI